MTARLLRWACAAAVFTVSCNRGHDDSRVAANVRLRAELLALRNADQDAVRTSYEARAENRTGNFLDRAHRLDEPIQRHRWPMVSVVAEDAARAAAAHSLSPRAA